MPVKSAGEKVQRRRPQSAPCMARSAHICPKSFEDGSVLASSSTKSSSSTGLPSESQAPVVQKASDVGSTLNPPDQEAQRERLKQLRSELERQQHAAEIEEERQKADARIQIEECDQIWRTEIGAMQQTHSYELDRMRDQLLIVETMCQENSLLNQVEPWPSEGWGQDNDLISMDARLCAARNEKDAAEARLLSVEDSLSKVLWQMAELQQSLSDAKVVETKSALQIQALERTILQLRRDSSWVTRKDWRSPRGTGDGRRLGSGAVRPLRNLMAQAQKASGTPLASFRPVSAFDQDKSIPENESVADDAESFGMSTMFSTGTLLEGGMSSVMDPFSLRPIHGNTAADSVADDAKSFGMSTVLSTGTLSESGMSCMDPYALRRYLADQENAVSPVADDAKSTFLSTGTLSDGGMSFMDPFALRRSSADQPSMNEECTLARDESSGNVSESSSVMTFDAFTAARELSAQRP